MFKDDYEVNSKIWEFFSHYIINLLKDENTTFPELSENYYILVKALVTHSIGTFYFKYNNIPKNLIDVLDYGVNSSFPNIYELSFKILSSLIEHIFSIKTNENERIFIVKNFYIEHFNRIFFFVFKNTIDGLHQNGIKAQIKILRILIGKMENENIIEANHKVYFKQQLTDYITKIGINLTPNQIGTLSWHCLIIVKMSILLKL